MSSLCIFTLFNRGRPCCTGIKVGETVLTYDLYRQGINRPYIEYKNNCEKIKSLIVQANERNHTIITSDFKAHLDGFKLPLTKEPYNVYDLHLPEVHSTGSAELDSAIVKKVVLKMAAQPLCPYQKLLANASVVYQDWQNIGVMRNYELVKPIWSLRTYSGRSKSLGVNLQGHSEAAQLRPIGSSDNDVIIYFDWIAADIRVASLLSGDKALEQSFIESDPYEYLQNKVNAGAKEPITRSEAKLFLLKSINSMDFTSVALSDVYPDLGKWILKCQHAIDNGQPLESILGRKFRLATAKNALAVLNGVMQGSVSHVMQNTIRLLWEKIASQLIVEIHDSLAVSCPPCSKSIRATIDVVVSIMLHPLAGLIASNPVFPVKVSIGKLWRKWSLFEIHRQNGVTRAKRPQDPTSTEETATETTQGPEEAAEESVEAQAI